MPDPSANLEENATSSIIYPEKRNPFGEDYYKRLNDSYKLALLMPDEGDFYYPDLVASDVMGKMGDVFDAIDTRLTYPEFGEVTQIPFAEKIPPMIVPGAGMLNTLEGYSRRVKRVEANSPNPYKSSVLTLLLKRDESKDVYVAGQGNGDRLWQISIHHPTPSELGLPFVYMGDLEGQNEMFYIVKPNFRRETLPIKSIEEVRKTYTTNQILFGRIVNSLFEATVDYRNQIN